MCAKKPPPAGCFLHLPHIEITKSFFGLQTLDFAWKFIFTIPPNSGYNKVKQDNYDEDDKDKKYIIQERLYLAMRDF